MYRASATSDLFDSCIGRLFGRREDPLAPFYPVLQRNFIHVFHTLDNLWPSVVIGLFFTQCLLCLMFLGLPRDVHNPMTEYGGMGCGKVVGKSE